MDIERMHRIANAGRATRALVLAEAERQGFIVSLSDDGMEMELPAGKCIDYDWGNPENHRFYWSIELHWNESMKEFWQVCWGELLISHNNIVDCDLPACRR